MRSGVQFFILMVLLNLAGVCMGVNEEYLSNSFCHDFWERETLTNGFWGLDDGLTDSGIEVGLGVTNIYQQNVHGGISTRRRAGRFSGSYDLELLADLEKLFGVQGSNVYLLVEGGWPDAEGIDEASVGSAWGINADAIGNEAAIVKELYYICRPFGESSELMIGKIDFTGYFDAAEYANDEVTQFLNAAFVDNPVIAFPEYSLGVVLAYNLTGFWYLMGGVADAQADGRESGFGTAFNGDNYFFYILECGFTPQLDSANGPLGGTYRVGLWSDPQPKANTDYEEAGESWRDDVGFYVSCDQMLAKENSDSEDCQGLGGFFRYGCADGKKNDITNFWSIGFQYQGLLDERDCDVLGVGFGQGFFSDSASLTYTEDYESALEVYYSAEVSPWFVVSPSVQYIVNPGGDENVSDSIVVGGRVLMIF